MNKLKFNPDNAKYYSEEFIKGFECGVERQFNADMAEKTTINSTKTTITDGDLKTEIDKLPRIKVGNSNSPTVKYCIDERLIYEVFDKHISGKENK